MHLRFAIVLVLAGLLVDTPFSRIVRTAAEDDPVTYDQVRSVFQKHCVSCHNAERPRGDFDISSLGAIRAGSASGPVSIPLDPDVSLLFTVVAHREEPFMPPNSPKIPQREIDLIRRWIQEGMLERKGDSADGKTRAPTGPVTKSSDNSLSAAQLGIVPVAPLSRPMPITALAVSPTEPVVAVSGNGQAVLFSLDDHKPIKAFDFPEGDVHVLKFSSDGELLLMGGGTGAVRGIVVGVDVKSGRRLFELGDEADVVLAADLSPDKQLVALGGPGRAVKSSDRRWRADGDIT
jgi:mono/diheme cytochrome c family protein